MVLGSAGLDAVQPEGGFLRRLRAAALIAVLVGAGGSVGLMLRAGRSSDERLLVMLIAGWVLAPFAALVLAHMVSTRWSVPTRATLYCLMLVLTLGSLAIYIGDAFGRSEAPGAAVFVGVPLASWLLIALVLPIAAFISGRLSRRGDSGH